MIQFFAYGVTFRFDQLHTLVGNYRAAHDMLLDYHKALRSKSVKVPAELDKMLMLLHSFLLVKVCLSL